MSRTRCSALVVRRRCGTPVSAHGITMTKVFYVYILASRYRGTMYVGVTNDLSRRIGEHKARLILGFTKTYKIDKLVYSEGYGSILEARARERVLKRWRRDWKIKLIETENPRWLDLSGEI
jgi:putative endonuclease